MNSPSNSVSNSTNPPSEIELLARALFRSALQQAKNIASIYGWSIKDENGHLLHESCPHCLGRPQPEAIVKEVGRVRVIMKPRSQRDKQT